jgi:cob(I)alamin adenosyltransferase
MSHRARNDLGRAFFGRGIKNIIMSITTRKGDEGRTDLMYGRRVSKTHPRIRACGVLDELNASLGGARAAIQEKKIQEKILLIQKDLIAVMGEVAVDDSEREKYQESNWVKLSEDSLQRLDEEIAALEARQKPVKDWAIPGENPTSAALDMSRAICRRAEREIIALADDQQTCWLPLNPLFIRYLNRLSDLLWLMARLPFCVQNDARAISMKGCNPALEGGKL